VGPARQATSASSSSDRISRRRPSLQAGYSPLQFPLLPTYFGSPLRLYNPLILLSISPLLPRRIAPPGRQNLSSESRTAATVRAQFRHNQVTPPPTFSTPLILLTMRTSLTPPLNFFRSDSTTPTPPEAHLRPPRLQPPLPLTSGSNRRSRSSSRAPLVELFPVVSSPSLRSRRNAAGARHLHASPANLAGNLASL
jgi:hypothetical protein